MRLSGLCGKGDGATVIPRAGTKDAQAIIIRLSFALFVPARGIKRLVGWMNGAWTPCARIGYNRREDTAGFAHKEGIVTEEDLRQQRLHNLGLSAAPYATPEAVVAAL